MRVIQLEEAARRATIRQQAGMWSYISPEQRVPTEHPLRRSGDGGPILADCRPRLPTLYSRVGRPSIPPEKLLRALRAAGALQHAQATAADGTVDYNLALFVVRRLNMDDRSGTPPCSRRTSALLDGDIRRPSLARPRAGAERGCCPTSTSPSMAPSRGVAI